LTDPYEVTREIDLRPVRAELGRHAARSGIVQLVSQAVRVLLLIGSGVILARLLTPADFGLMAMVATLVGFVESFRDFGLPLAVTHQNDFDRQQFTALFRTSLQLNLGTTLFMMIAGPFLAEFYDEPRVIAVTMVTAAGYLVLGFGTLHQAVLIREMRFRRLAAVELGSQVAGTMTGVLAALLGAGYWALVGQLVVGNVVKGLTLWMVSGWRSSLLGPGLSRSDPRVRTILQRGAHIAGFEIVNYFGRNSDNVVVGFVGGPTALGLYDSAWRWSLYPIQQVYAPLVGVAVSSLSRVRDDPDAYRRACRVGLLPIFSMVTPALVFLLLQADLVIVGVFGEQWRASVPIFRVLVVAALASSVMRILGWLYLSEGRSREQLRWGVVYTAVMVMAVIAGAHWGVYGVAVAVAAGNCLLLVPGLSMCLHRSPFRIGDLLSVLARPVAASLTAATVLVVMLSRPTQQPVRIWELGVQAAAFAAIYALTWVALPGGRREAERIIGTVRAAARPGVS